MSRLILLISLWAASFQLLANDERQAIETSLRNYIDGTSYNDGDKIRAAFYPSANLYLEKADTPLWKVKAADYIKWFKPEKEGQFSGRVGEILSIDIESGIATAKAEILLPAKKVRFIDMFLLKKLDGQWRIISKSAQMTESQNTGERILFIVSSAFFHGDSKLPAGVSFSEIVKAYDTFKQAGFRVDFVSPEGGALPLSYINTSEPIHRKYLYNPDFMYAIGNTKTPDEIVAKNYRAVHYVGGNNAMYGVAENEAIQKIAMEVYEKHNGILSSVCHGTAGIVNLKTKDGNYLVAGKRISGYPESFENQSRAYFQEFPFLIQKTIEARGGLFFHSARNTPHLEVDGRIVTGQNHLSSPLVAEKMVEMLRRM